MADVPSRFVRPVAATEREEVARLCRASTAVRVRAEIVLLSAQRVPIPEIMRRVGVSRPTVATWLRRFEAWGPAGLRTGARPGRPPKLTPAIVHRIATVAAARPCDVGAEGTTWSLASLGAYLATSPRMPQLSLESLRIAIRRSGINLKPARTGTTWKGTTMIPAAFEYHTPRSLAEATDLLAQHGEHAKVLSGGHSLIPLMKLRLARPRHVIDITGIPDLAYVREADGFLRIGALTRESDLEESELVRTRYPLLFDTTTVIADPLVRNVATVGGNLAHGDPANDHPATMLAYGAEIAAVGRTGKRRIPIGAFFTGPFTTSLAPDEILVEISIPVPPPRSGGAYLKLERKVGDFATAAVAAQVTLGADGVCERVGIGLTNVGPTPISAERAEAVLRGKRPDDATLKEAARVAAQQSDPSADLRGSIDYKRDLVRVLAARALAKALERAGGGR